MAAINGHPMAAGPQAPERRRRKWSAPPSGGAEPRQPPAAIGRAESGVAPVLPRGQRDGALLPLHRAVPRSLSRFASRQGQFRPGAQWRKSYSGGQQQRPPLRKKWKSDPPAGLGLMGHGTGARHGRSLTRQREASGRCSPSEGAAEVSKKLGNGLPTHPLESARRVVVSRHTQFIVVSVGLAGLPKPLQDAPLSQLMELHCQFTASQYRFWQLLSQLKLPQRSVSP